MIDINEALKLESTAELDRQVEERRKLIGDMVGQLYPAILRSEIDRLQARKWEIIKAGGQ